jgi:hypothetical protein
MGSCFESCHNWPGGPEGPIPAPCAPEQPPRCPSLIPGGDQYSSRRQRSREACPLQGATLRGSNASGVTRVTHPAAQGDTTPSGSGKERRTFRGRCPRLLSRALAGHEKTILWPYPAAPVFDIADSGLRLSWLRMIAEAHVGSAPMLTRSLPFAPKPDNL